MCDCSEWSATRVGADRVRLAGRCTCPMAGYDVSLRPVAAQPDPGRLVLEVVAVPPEFGATVITTVDVVWEGEAAPEVREVDVGGVTVPVG